MGKSRMVTPIFSNRWLSARLLEINTKIEYAQMSMDLDQYVEKLKEEPTPEAKESAHDELVRLLGLNLNN